MSVFAPVPEVGNRQPSFSFRPGTGSCTAQDNGPSGRTEVQALSFDAAL